MHRPSLPRHPDSRSITHQSFFSPHIPFQLDYLEVLDGLCHTLALMYQAIGHHAESLKREAALFDALVKIDVKVGLFYLPPHLPSSTPSSYSPRLHSPLSLSRSSTTSLIPSRRNSRTSLPGWPS